MSKAEKAALKAYPVHNVGDPTLPYGEWDLNGVSRRGFQEGYEQAEKDLALTWEDVQLLHIITEKYMRELDNRIEAFPSSSQEVFEEVLTRFKQYKEAKQ